MNSSIFPNLPQASNPIAFKSNSTALGGSGVSQPQGTSPGFMDNLLGFTDENNVQHNGWGVPAMQGLGGLAQSWLGFQNLNLAKDQFNFQKDSFLQQYDQQANMLNTQMEDRQRARLNGRSAENTGYKSIGDYMTDHGAKNYGG